MAEQSGLIQWRCAAAGHQQAQGGHTADTLTVHDGTWAYCPRNVAADDHVWIATGGVQIEMLRRGSPTISLDVDVKPASRPAPGRAPVRAGGTTPRKRTTPRG